MDEKYQKFLDTEFTVFDIETSGLDPVKDEILEIAAIKLVGEKEVGRFEALIQPARAISPEVEKIHGLNEIFLLVNGRNAREVMGDFLVFIRDSIIVGHNIKEFDWLFVSALAGNLGLETANNKMIDTLELSRKILSLSSYNLSGVAGHFGYENKNAHRAMPDVEVNTKVFLDLMKLLFGQE